MSFHSALLKRLFTMQEATHIDNAFFLVNTKHSFLHGTFNSFLIFSGTEPKTLYYSTTSLNIRKFYFLPTGHLYLLYVSQEKHRSFPYTALNDRLF